MSLRSHCVAEMRPPLASIVADHKGGSKSIRTFVATLMPIRKAPRDVRVIFGEMGVYYAR